MGNRSKAKAETNGATAKADGKFSLISDQKLIALYQHLLKCSMRTRSGARANVALRGQEAAVVGTAIDLESGDVLCFQERGLHPGAPDGATIQNLLTAEAPDPRGLSKLRKMNAAMQNGTRPGTGDAYVHTAIGTALAHKTRKNGKIAVVFSSEQAAHGLREAVEIASIHGLPMIFVQQWKSKRNGNGAKPKSPLSKKSSQPEVPWFPEITVDSNDLVAVYRVANEAISRARLGRGPTVIECLPFSTSDSGSRNGRLARDPVSNMEYYLRAKGLFDPETKRATRAASRKQ